MNIQGHTFGSKHGNEFIRRHTTYPAEQEIIRDITAFTFGQISDGTESSVESKRIIQSPSCRHATVYHLESVGECPFQSLGHMISLFHHLQFRTVIKLKRQYII